MDKLLDRVLEEYKKIAFADVNEIVIVDENNKLSLKLNNYSSAIAQIYQVSSRYGNTIKIKMHDKLEALKFLSNYLKLTDNNDIDCLKTMLNLPPEKIQEMIDKVKNM